MSDAAFREALDAYHDALLGCQCTKCGGGDPADAAHARVLALYAEAQQQGERDQLALAEQVAEATMRMEQGRAERLTAGEEVVRVVNPEYPGDKHYWAANNVPTFPASYIITPGTFRVTPLDGGTDG